MKNPIIAELRRIRDKNAKRHNFNLDSLARELMKLEPWMERKTYALHQGKLVPVASLRGKPSRRSVQKNRARER